MHPAALLDEMALKFKDLHFIPAREEALYACLTAIHECFDSFLSMDLDTACTVPNLFFVRTGYAARALRKLLNICDSQAEFEGSSHIDVRNLKFEEYLNSIIHLLVTVHSENNATIPRAFALVMTQIKTQAIESSKLLSTIRLPDDDKGSSKGDDQKSLFPNLSEPLHQDCHHLLDKKSGLPWLDDATKKPSTVPNDEPDQPPLFNAPLDPLLQMDPSQWHRNGQDDAFMTGIDVLQWFEQDFALNSGLIEYDGLNLPPGPTTWQQ
jgi:hypothetical protein